MSKSELRNFLNKCYKDDPRVCITAEAYSVMSFEVTLVDALTRLHHIRKPEAVFNGDKFRTSAVQDGGYFMSLVEDSFDFYFRRGSQVLVWMIDKSCYIPDTKGVEQRRRVDDTNADIQDLDSPDVDIQEAAEARLLQLSRTWPGISDEAKKYALGIRKKLDDRETKMQKIAATKERLTILEVDNMRKCWDRLPMTKKREIIAEAQSLGIDVYWLNGQSIVREKPPGFFDEQCVLDDYHLEAVLLATVRNMMLPEPWDVFIKRGRSKIIRYIVRSLLHGFYDAYAPQLGTRLFIDGHDYPGWRMAKPGTFTFGDMDDKSAPLTIEAVTVADDGLKSRKRKTRSILEPYSNFAPLLLMHPNEIDESSKTSEGVKEHDKRDREDVYKMCQPPASNVSTFLRNSQRGSIPNCLQPQWRYAKEYGHKIGESDFSIFHWIEKLRNKPGAKKWENYTKFEIVSTDTDVLYLALLYLVKIRRHDQSIGASTTYKEPEIVIIMESGWFAHRKLIFNVNNLLDAIIDDHLGGLVDLVPNFIYSFYASAGDYTIGFKYAPPKSFIKAYLDHFDYIGCIMSLWTVNGIEFPMLDGMAYRRLLSAAYFVSHDRTARNKANIDAVDDITDISRLRHLLNPHLVKKEYHKYFENNDPRRRLVTVPEYNGEINTPAQKEEKRKTEKLFDLMITNIQKKIPSDEEIMKRGLLLQNFMCMCHQVGASELTFCQPTAFGYQPVDPDIPLSRSNIEFSSSCNYELEEYFVRIVEMEEEEDDE